MREGFGKLGTSQSGGRMRLAWTRHMLAILILGSLGAPATQAADSPKDRQGTDPKSVSSAANAAAKPVPIEDLFYSRRVSSPAWSPDGKRIVFTTNLTGRNNLWVVNSDGGWPVQLTVSDDRQDGSVWMPDARMATTLLPTGETRRPRIRAFTAST